MIIDTRKLKEIAEVEFWNIVEDVIITDIKILMNLESSLRMVVLSMCGIL